MKKLILVFFATTLLSLSAFAQYGKQGQWELSPYFGVMFPDDYGNFDLTEGPLAGFRFGYFIVNPLSAELSFQRSFAEVGGGQNNADIDGYRLNFLWNFRTGIGLVPFLTGGIGMERFDTAAIDAQYDLGYNGGLGIRFFASQNAGLRLEGRYVASHVDLGPTTAWENNIEATLGVFFLLGKHAKPAAVVATPKDSDADTITDDIDQCPGTPAGTSVDAKGCAVVTDDDKDGVANMDDKCPATPENAPVDQTGCPTDMDGDNVKDYMDKCPNTPAAVQVDDMGCPLKSKARGVLNGVTFKTGSPELTENAKTVLNGVATELKHFPEVKVEIQGHTDNTGSDALNLTVSQKRAEAVLKYLTSQGIPAEQMTAKGYGESAPIADNKTAIGRTKNRRVEMKWID